MSTKLHNDGINFNSPNTLDGRTFISYKLHSLRILELKKWLGKLFECLTELRWCVTNDNHATGNTKVEVFNALKSRWNHVNWSERIFVYPEVELQRASKLARFETNAVVQATTRRSRARRVKEDSSQLWASSDISWCFVRSNVSMCSNNNTMSLCLALITAYNSLFKLGIIITAIKRWKATTCDVVRWVRSVWTGPFLSWDVYLWERCFVDVMSNAVVATCTVVHTKYL